MAPITQRFLVLVSTVSAGNAWHSDLPIPKRGYFQKNWEGVCGTILETLSPFSVILSHDQKAEILSDSTALAQVIARFALNA